MCQLSKVKKQTSYLPSGERSCFSAKLLSLGADTFEHKARDVWATRIKHIEKFTWNPRPNNLMNHLVDLTINFCPHVMAPSSWRHGPLNNEETRLLLRLLQRASNHQLFLDKCRWALCPLQKGRDVWKFPMPWHRGQFFLLVRCIDGSQERLLYHQLLEIQHCELGKNGTFFAVTKQP